MLFFAKRNKAGKNGLSEACYGVRKWQKARKNQFFIVKNADMNRRSGWDNVPVADSGIPCRKNGLQ